MADVANGLSLQVATLAEKAAVVTGWTLDLLFSRDLEQMLTMRDVEALAQMAGRARKLVAQRSTTTSLAERMDTPVFLKARRPPEERARLRLRNLTRKERAP